MVDLTLFAVTARVAMPQMNKTGWPRDVPLSARALERWKVLPDGFGMTAAHARCFVSRRPEAVRHGK